MKCIHLLWPEVFFPFEHLHSKYSLSHSNKKSCKTVNNFLKKHVNYFRLMQRTGSGYMNASTRVSELTWAEIIIYHVYQYKRSVRLNGIGHCIILPKMVSIPLIFINESRINDLEYDLYCDAKMILWLHAAAHIRASL